MANSTKYNCILPYAYRTLTSFFPVIYVQYAYVIPEGERMVAP